MDTDDTLGKLKTVVEFIIKLASQADLNHPIELQMEEAVGQGVAAFQQMSTITTMFTRAKDNVDNAQTIISGVTPIAFAWDPLLKKMELFTNLVDGIAEVCQV